MTRALAAINDATSGGVYYTANIDFTNSAVQPTWARLAITGLANTSIKVMQNDYFTPYDDIYLQLDNDNVYHWNGASWDSIMDLATARTLVSQPVGLMGYITVDKSAAGTIYIPMAQSTISVKLLKSTDYGANWSVITVAVDAFVTAYAFAQCYGQYLHVCVGWVYRHHVYSQNGGGLWTDQAIWPNTSGGAPIRVDTHNPTKVYYRDDAANNILVEIIGPATKTALQNTYVLGSDFHDRHWIDPLVTGHQRILRVTTDAKLFSTTDSWANLVTTTPTQLQATADWSALHAAYEEDDYILYGKTAAGGTGHKVWAVNGETSGTTWGINGTNVTTPPYTGAIPGTSTTYIAVQGLYVGEGPSDSGVYVYADEMGDITSLPSYTGLGTPMFGDRSAWRDRPVDGLDIYHAEDVEREEPQIHAPWDDTDPPPVGYGIVSDGNHWVVSTDEIALDGDLAHNILSVTHTDTDAADIPVEGDALVYRTAEWVAEAGVDIGSDAADIDWINVNEQAGTPAQPGAGHWLIYAKSDGFYEEDDAGNETKLAGANSLDDLSDVDITGAGQGDILYDNAGTWEDYPLGIGIDIVNDGASIKIGNIAGGDYLQVDTTTGDVQLTGDAVAWEDLRVEPTVRQSAGAGVPSFEKWFDDSPGTSRGVYLYSFTDEAVAGNEKEIFFTMQMPHAWKIGTDISFHVHFVPAATVNSSDIIWGLEYCWKGIGEIYGDTVIIQSSTTLLPDDANITANKHYLAEFTDLVPGTTASSLSSILIGRLFRNSSAAGDTYTNKVGLLYIDAHYQVDSFGSFEEYEKEILLSDSDGITLLDSDGIELAE